MTSNEKPRHPEQGDDEVFVGNLDDEGFRETCFKTKRRGKQAYYTDGRPIPESVISWEVLYPTFVKLSEFEEHQRRVDKQFGTGLG